MLIRNPIFFMQCILPVLIMPIIFTMIFITGDSIDISKLGEITDVDFTPTTICIVLSAIQFLTMMSFIAVTAISRDGQYAKFMKYIPISLYNQTVYKIAPAIIVNIFPILFVNIILYLLFPKQIFSIICIFGIAMILNIIQSQLMIIVDLKRPKLEWDTEYAVVKQNMNMAFEIVLVLALIGIIGAIGFIFNEYGNFVTIIILTVIFTIAFFIINAYIYKNQNKLYNKII